jgi:hypothetical protein
VSWQFAPRVARSCGPSADQLGGPLQARRQQPRLAPSLLVVLRRQAGDAAGLAPAAGRRRLDLPAPRNRATATRPGAAADRPLGRENPRWGDQRSKGELQHLGIRVWATAIRTTLRRHGPDRRRDRRPRPGGRSCASRRPASSHATSSRSTPSGCGGWMGWSSSNWPPAGSRWPA